MKNYILILIVTALATSCAQKKVAPEIVSSKHNLDDYRKVIRDPKNDYSGCYSTFLKNNPEAEVKSGKVVVKWHIIEKGKGEKFNIVSSEIKSKVLSKCIINILSGLTYPEPPVNQIIEVVYPFMFSDEVDPAKDTAAPTSPGATPQKEEPKQP